MEGNDQRGAGIYPAEPNKSAAPESRFRGGANMGLTKGFPETAGWG
jgi:hypothetical protein